MHSHTPKLNLTCIDQKRCDEARRQVYCEHGSLLAILVTIIIWFELLKPKVKTKKKENNTQTMVHSKTAVIITVWSGN